MQQPELAQNLFRAKIESPDASNQVVVGGTEANTADSSGEVGAQLGLDVNFQQLQQREIERLSLSLQTVMKRNKLLEECLKAAELNLSSKQSEIDNLREANTDLTSRLEDVTTLAQTIDSCTVTESEPPLKKVHLAAD